MESTKISFGVFLFGVLLLSASVLPSDLFSQAPFYQGKTITVVRGGEPGGAGHMQALATVNHLKKYIPGQPTIVIEHMPGAAGRKAANHIYSVARPDGLTFGAVGGGLAVGPVMGLPGSSYDLDKLIYLGSTESGESWVFFSRKAAGLDTLDKLRAATGLRIGAQAVGHPGYQTGRIFAFFLGLKEAKFVTGYGGPELDLALIRGEVDAKGNDIGTVLQRNPEWLEKEKGSVHFHATIPIPRGKKYPRFDHLPELDSFAKSERERKVLAMFRAFLYPRWPYILPPGTPREQVEILREAMAKTYKDPEFHAEFVKLMGRESSPLTGAEVEQSIKELPRDPETVEWFKKFSGLGPLPSR